MRSKPTIRRENVSLALEYVSMGKDEPGKVYRNFPRRAERTNELAIAIRPFDPDIEERQYNAATHGKPQIILAGPAEALEELGKYLIALARLETTNESPGEHYDDVQNADGGTTHLIVRRTQKS